MQQSLQASVVSKTRSPRRRIVMGVMFALALLPGCRLYELLTGTGYYQPDPFLCPSCTSSLPFDDQGDELSLEADSLQTLDEPPYLEEDFTGEQAPIEAEGPQEWTPYDSSIIEPDEFELPSEPPRPAAEMPPADEPLPEESPFGLEFAEPEVEPEAEPEAEPPAPEQPTESAPLEDPFPLDLPQSDLMPPKHVPTDLDLEETLDLAPAEPEADSRPETTRETESENGLDELELFDDAINPDLELDFPEAGGERTSSDDADLPPRMYPTARRPSADSYFGRCLFAPSSLDHSPRMVRDRGRGESQRRRVASSESTEIPPPHPGRGIFDTAWPLDHDDETENVNVGYEEFTPKDRR